MWKRIIGIAAAGLLVTSGALAQQKDKGATTKTRSAESIECSKQANQKGLHGKARKTFRTKCMRDMRKQGGTKT
jgi:hypothetical protein